MKRVRTARILAAGQSALSALGRSLPRPQNAGCASYTAWIAGRHVTYDGHPGEMHMEHFQG
jgi:hypothetical protein